MYRELFTLSSNRYYYPVYGLQPEPEKSSTQTLQIHQPTGYALVVVEFEFGKRKLLKFELKRGENVLEELIASLESLAKQIYLEKRKYYTFTGTPTCTREEAHTCWICETEFALMIKFYLINVIIPTSSWGGCITNATSIEKRRTIFP